jgi:hypothetical protein
MGIGSENGSDKCKIREFTGLDGRMGEIIGNVLPVIGECNWAGSGFGWGELRGKEADDW